MPGRLAVSLSLPETGLTFEKVLANSVPLMASAPMTPVVKLVFGADYDKTRLTEYATALTHAQRIGLGRGFEGFGSEGWVGYQPADGLQGLGCHAFLGDPVGGADKGQVGHQQDSGEQHQQGGQQFLPDG